MLVDGVVKVKNMMYLSKVTDEVLDFVQRELVAVKCEGNSVVAPRVYHNANKLSPGTIGFAYSMFGLCVAVGLAIVVWSWTYRQVKLLKATQPGFLIVMVVGCIMASISIVFGILLVEDPYNDLNLEGKTEVEIEDLTWSAGNTYCFLELLFYSQGMGLAFAALFAKMLRIYKLLNVKKIRAVKIRVRDVAPMSSFMMGVQLVIIVAWQLVDPLTWRRIVVSTNSAGIVTASRVVCMSSLSSTFLIPLVGVQLLCFLAGCVLSFMSRRVPGAFNEGKFITLAIVNQAELFIIAVPMLIMVQPFVQVFVVLKVVFIAMQVSSAAPRSLPAALVERVPGVAQTIGTLALLFIPKLYIMFVDPKAMAISLGNSSDNDNSSRTGGDQSRVYKIQASASSTSAQVHPSGASNID
jgi:hypothetical protein